MFKCFKFLSRYNEEHFCVTNQFFDLHNIDTKIIFKFFVRVFSQLKYQSFKLVSKC